MMLLGAAAMGGAIGAAGRHLLNLAAARAGVQFPWHTLAINVAGSLLIGFVVELVARRLDGSEAMRVFLATGVLGGFTTFSAFSLEMARLIERGMTGPALAYAVSSVCLSLVAVFVGLWLARAVW